MFTITMLFIGLFFFLSLSLYIGISLFKHRPNHNVQEGEVFVNGEGHVSLLLHCRKPPRFITVNFVDNVHSHPCHPCNHHHDWFDWDVVREGHHCFKFSIFYKVGGLRRISYKIIY